MNVEELMDLLDGVPDEWMVGDSDGREITRILIGPDGILLDTN